MTGESSGSGWSPGVLLVLFGIGCSVLVPVAAGVVWFRNPGLSRFQVLLRHPWLIAGVALGFGSILVGLWLQE